MAQEGQCAWMGPLTLGIRMDMICLMLWMGYPAVTGSRRCHTYQLSRFARETPDFLPIILLIVWEQS